MTEQRRKPGPRPFPYKTRPISVRVTENEHRKLNILAQRLNTTVGDVLRKFGVNKAVKTFDKTKE